MTSKKSVKGASGTAKPKQSWVAIGQMGRTAQNLATTHSAELGARLTPTLLANLASDIATLSSDVPNAISAKTGAKQSTDAQNDALIIGRNLVSGVHTAVRSQSTDKNVRTAYGVGIAVPVLVKHVVSALNTIVARATSQPAEAATFGIIPDDITAFNAALTSIATADAAQEAARAAAPASTKIRNATARRILATVKLIAGAGMRVFANDPTIRAQFEALK